MIITLPPPPGRGVKYSDQHVCLFVCLYVSTCMSQKPHVQISLNFLYVVPMAMARSSDGNVIHYIRPVLLVISCFHIVDQMGRIRDDTCASSTCQVAAPVRRHTTLRHYVWSIWPGGGTGGEVCRPHCILFACCRTRVPTPPGKS